MLSEQGEAAFTEAAANVKKTKIETTTLRKLYSLVYCTTEGMRILGPGSWTRSVVSGQSWMISALSLPM